MPKVKDVVEVFLSSLIHGPDVVRFTFLRVRFGMSF
jgi:hypothetical protein